MEQLWNKPAARGHNKFEAMKGLDPLFKEYMICEITKEIRRIEEASRMDNCWEGVSMISISIEIGRDKGTTYFGSRRLCGGSVKEPYGASMVIGIQSFFMGKPYKEGKLTTLKS